MLTTVKKKLKKPEYTDKKDIAVINENFDKLDDLVTDGFVIVAAVNSFNKEKADFICDAVGDQEQLRLAINRIKLNGTAGGTILLMPGDYFFNKDGVTEVDGVFNLVELEDNISIIGFNANIKLDTNTIQADKKCNMFYANAKTGMRIEGIRIDCNGNTNANNVTGIRLLSCNDILVTNVTVMNAVTNGYGLYLSGNDAKVFKNLLVNCTFGIYLASGTNSMIHMNKVRNCVNGIYNLSTYADIQMNMTRNCTTQSIYNSGNYSRVANNDCYGKAPSVTGTGTTTTSANRS